MSQPLLPILRWLVYVHSCRISGNCQLWLFCSLPIIDVLLRGGELSFYLFCHLDWKNVLFSLIKAFRDFFCFQYSEILHWCALGWITIYYMKFLVDPFYLVTHVLQFYCIFWYNCLWWVSWFSALHFWSCYSMDIRPTLWVLSFSYSSLIFLFLSSFFYFTSAISSTLPFIFFIGCIQLF